MLPVEIYPVQDALVLRARGSELLILSDHVVELKKLKAAGEFAKYFLDEALVNRPARKLFEAWLRKDGSLWARIYKAVQTLEATGSEETSEAHAVTESIREAAKGHNSDVTLSPPNEMKGTKAKASEDHKTSEKSASKSSEGDSDKKTTASATSKSTTKPAGKSTGKPASKSTSKPAAKVAPKSAVKPTSRPVAKPAPKKSKKV